MKNIDLFDRYIGKVIKNIKRGNCRICNCLFSCINFLLYTIYDNKRGRKQTCWGSIKWKQLTVLLLHDNETTTRKNLSMLMYRISAIEMFYCVFFSLFWQRSYCLKITKKKRNKWKMRRNMFFKIRKPLCCTRWNSFNVQKKV